MVRRHAFEAANSYRSILHAATTTRRFAWTVADPAQDAWKDIRLAILYIRIAEAPLGDQPDIFRNIGVGGTCPLAIDDLMEVLRVGGVSRFHCMLAPDIIMQPTLSPIPCWALA